MAINKIFKFVLIFVSLFAVLALVSVYNLYKNKVGTFDEKLTEISGIEFDKSGKFWAINDGGDSPNLYRVNDKGEINKTIRVTNAKNIDWEDMTQDDFGHFFLGDFGNNENKRKWLTVYKIENPIDIKGNETEAEIIKLNYPEHKQFPPAPDQKIFDLEAFVHYKKNLYLFTKNRKVPFDGVTTLYKIGAYAANHDAKKISEFTTCTLNTNICRITSAALNPSRDKLALLDSRHIWLFENWQGDDFFSGDAYRIDLGIVTQKEAITFFDDNTIIFTDEEFMGIGRNAYVIEIDNLVKHKVSKD